MNFFSRLFQTPKEKRLEGYSEFFDQMPLPGNTALNNIRFVALDTETSGLNPNTDHILSIAAVAIKNGAICLEDSFYRIISHQKATQSISIHHITPTDSMSHGVTLEEAIEDFACWLKDAVLVGHHVAFDKSILSNALYRHHGLNLKNKATDTALLAIRLFESGLSRDQIKPSEYGLDKLAERLQMPIFERHTAEGDTLTTAAVFLSLQLLATKRGIKTLGSLLKSA